LAKCRLCGVEVLSAVLTAVWYLSARCSVSMRVPGTVKPQPSQRAPSGLPALHGRALCFWNAGRHATPDALSDTVVRRVNAADGRRRCSAVFAPAPPRD
jgi:hypothetical protein